MDRDGRRSHNPEVTGLNPVPATREKPQVTRAAAFFTIAGLVRSGTKLRWKGLAGVDDDDRRRWTSVNEMAFRGVSLMR